MINDNSSPTSRPKGMSDIELAAIRLVRLEKTQWEDAVVFVTDRVAFQMRNLIRILRKNYWGVYDEPIDPTTGRKKIWYPITEEMVNAVVRAIDLDTKDVNIRAKNSKGYATAPVIRAIVRDHLTKTYFGEDLDMTELQGAMDGTVVWKTWKENRKVKRRIVDLLNFYIDPQAESIQQTPSVIERAVLTKAEVISHTGWMNRDMIMGVKDVPPTDNNLAMNYTSGGTRGETELVDVYERWGLMSEYLITGKKEDKSKEVEGHIVIANLDNNQPVVLLVEKNNTKDSEGNIIKPYEEWRLLKVNGRWYGRGIAERVMMLQTWMNTVINTRINRHYLSQLGLFKIRRGSGITPQILSKFPSNGAVLVNSMDDLQQFVIQEASQSSYSDEQNIRDIAVRLTSAFEVVTGEGLPASTPATNVVIQDRNARSAFTMIKESLGSFLQRWVDRHLLRLLAETLNTEEVFRILGDDDKANDYIERVALYHADKQLEELRARGIVPTPEEIVVAIDAAKERLRKRGELFIEPIKELAVNNVDTKVYVTNEELDVSVMIQNLTSILPMVPELQNQIARQIMDLMGLDMPPLPPRQNPIMGGKEKQRAQGVDTSKPTPTEQRIATASGLSSGGVV
jgi:hypothetical protein